MSLQPIKTITQKPIVGGEVELLYGKDSLIELFTDYMNITTDYGYTKYKDSEDKSLGKEDAVSYECVFFRKSEINHVGVSYDNEANVWFVCMVCDGKSTWLNVESKQRGLEIQEQIKTWLFY